MKERAEEKNALKRQRTNQKANAKNKRTNISFLIFLYNERKFDSEVFISYCFNVIFLCFVLSASQKATNRSKLWIICILMSIEVSIVLYKVFSMECLKSLHSKNLLICLENIFRKGMQLFLIFSLCGMPSLFNSYKRLQLSNFTSDSFYFSLFSTRHPQQTVTLGRTLYQ